MSTDQHPLNPHRSNAAWSALQQLNEAIRFADVKVTAVLAADGLLGSQLWAGRYQPATVGANWQTVLLTIAGVSAALSALLTLLTLAPRRQITDLEALHHFDDVAQRYARNSQGFIDAWLATTADDDATSRMLAGHIWAANLVAHHKFTRASWSIRLLAVGVAAWVAAGLG
ncbi:Pycsar system effector family protein [Micromonospora sp. PTRAS2]